MKSAMFAVGCAATLLVVQEINAAQITSANFSFGYGHVVSEWNDSETSSVNTSTSQGNFVFAPAPNGPRYRGIGPTFINRVLGNGDSESFVGAAYDGQRLFSVPITANYTGAAPGDASGTPNYQLQIEITSVSIYGGSEDAAVTTMALRETTAGHAQTQPTPVTVPVTSFGAGSSITAYAQAVWNPGDYSTSLASLNDSFTRTFGVVIVVPNGQYDPHYIDGLEVTGRVHLIYDAIPEPASLSLLALVAPALLTRRRH